MYMEILFFKSQFRGHQSSSSSSNSKCVVFLRKAYNDFFLVLLEVVIVQILGQARG